jgi:hypothetical protein
MDRFVHVHFINELALKSAIAIWVMGLPISVMGGVSVGGSREAGLQFHAGVEDPRSLAVGGFATA